MTHDADATEAQWSPNGNWLAFGPTLQESSGDMRHSATPCRSRATWARDRSLVLVDTSLDWSPDGDHIAYYSHQFPDSPDNYLLVLDMTTNEVIEWNAVGGSCCGEGFFGNPAWSP